MSFLNVENINKSFGKLNVIKDISFSMEKGEVLAIIGSSGSGKSTLLRCLNGLERADKGSITVGNEKLVTVDKDGNSIYPSSKEKRVSPFGMVFQSFNLFPHLTVLENISLAPINVSKMNKVDARNLSMQLLERVGLKEKAKALPYQLSGGQSQRVAIARALAMNPDIICFDEPTSALDPELTTEVLNVIRELRANGNTMIVVTHEMSFARDCSDRIMFMENGVIEEIGESKEVYYNPKSDRTKAFMNTIKQL